MSRRHRRPTIEPLEPRLLFSASADMVLLDDADSHVTHLPDAAANIDLSQIYSGYHEQAELRPANTNDNNNEALTTDNSGEQQFAEKMAGHEGYGGDRQLEYRQNEISADA